MDPLTITTSVLTITAKCVSATKGLYELREHFKYADLTIVSICSESTIISASLSQLQFLVLRTNNLQNVLKARPELAAALDTALIGCAALYSCLEMETKRMRLATALAGNSTWKSKAKMIWSKDQLKELLDSLRGQQTAINTIISLLQMDSLEEIKRLLHNNRDTFARVAEKTRSLREQEPDVEVPRSIYGNDDSRSVYSTDPSITAPSELEFDFDDQIVSSKVYRRFLAQAMHKKQASDANVVGGDLLNFSDDLTIKDVASGLEDAEDAARLLGGIDLHETSQQPPDDQLAAPASDTTFSGEVIASITALHEPKEPSNHSPRAPRQRREKKFADYILGETIGDGEQAKVKVAWKKEGGAQVAMKLIRRDNLLHSDSAGLSKVYRQVAILRSLQHRRIVRLYEMIETERHIGISLEYASGGSLGEFVDKHKFLEDSSARRLYAQLVSGLGYLHQSGIVHRNLNLDNVLLDRDRNIIIAGFRYANKFKSDDKLGEVVESKLGSADYVSRMGLDIIYEDGYRRGDLMQTHCGSSVYAAPEVILCDTLYAGRKADVWSCGIILYAMLAGHLPWDATAKDYEHSSINDLYTRILNTPLGFPEYVTPKARDLLRRILIPDPCKRADLRKIARHSWLSRYSHVVAFITA